MVEKKFMANIDTNSAENKTVFVDYRNNRSLVKYGLGCHWWNAEPTSMHVHNFYEFFIITSGEAEHEINGEKQKLRRGMLELIRPEDKHRIVSSCVKKSAHVNISVTAEKLNAVCSALDLPFEELVARAGTVVNLSVDELDGFVSKAEKISLMHYNSDDRRHVLIGEILVDAIYVLYKRQISSSSGLPDKFNEILEKLHSPEYLDANASDVYSLAGFSAPIVISAFKKYTGKTVEKYLRGIKMSKAEELLSNSDMPLVEISNLLGYASLSHFNTVFKEYTGITPAVYRKSAKAKR